MPQKLFIFLSIVSLSSILGADSFDGIKKYPQHTAVFWDLDDDKIVASSNPNLKLNPASVSKLVSSAYFLNELGPDYQIPTEVYLDSSPSNSGIVKGNLSIKGYGNPFFVTEDMYILTQELRIKGVKRIEGNIILDTSFFKDETMIINATSDRSSRAYSAKLSSLSVNFNAFGIKATRSNGKCVYHFDPIDTEYIQVIKIGNNSSPPRGYFSDIKNQKERYNIQGCEGVGYTSVQSPPHYFGHLLKAFLKLQGIEVTGSIVINSIPSKASLVYTHLSPPVSKLIESMNTYSNNFMSEMLLLHIAAKKSGKAGSYEEGVKLLNTFTSSIREDGAILLNASGLTKGNALSCQFVVDLLRKIKKDPLSFSAHYLSMARISKEGTLSDRLRLKDFNVSAKTGTLTNPTVVSSLAGYMTSKKGKLLGFCIVLNGTPSVDAAKTIQNDLLVSIGNSN